jgi:hypothetical protein
MNSFGNSIFLVGKMVHIPKLEFWDVTIFQLNSKAIEKDHKVELR